MTEDTTAIHGVDREQFEAFADRAQESPEEVQFGLGARATYEGKCGHSLATIDSFEFGGETIARDTRRYTIPYGGWKDVWDDAGWIGATDRMEPIEVALSALAACINVGITINAVANGVGVEHLETRVRTDYDPAVLLNLAGLKEADAVFENLIAEIEIEGDGLDKDLVDEWARRAPVCTLVSLAHDLEMTVGTPAEVAATD